MTNRNSNVAHVLEPDMFTFVSLAESSLHRRTRKYLNVQAKMHEAKENAREAGNQAAVERYETAMSYVNEAHMVSRLGYSNTARCLLEMTASTVSSRHG